tara:strand:+ start:4550 stop:4897 length:348 start_codon:yes stop_codon:yes gene_type:complete
MITTLETPKEILGFEITGKLKKEDYNKLEPLMDKQQKEFGSLKLLAVYDEFEWPTTEALKEDLKSYFKYDINKLAIVSKTKWLREATDSIPELMPKKIQSKGFESKEKAIDWLQK